MRPMILKSKKVFANITLPFLLSLQLPGIIAVAQGKDAGARAPIQSADSSFEDLKAYWQSFESYKRSLMKESKDRSDAAMAEIEKKSYEKAQKQLSDRIDKLKQSELIYRSIVEKDENSPQRGTAILSLTQILFLQSLLQKGESKQKQEESVNLLAKFEEKYTSNVHYPRALYLHGLILKEQKKINQAQSLFKKLASTPEPTLFKAYALTYLGDEAFNREDAEGAADWYKGALSVLTKLGTSATRYEHLRNHYRLAWAYYRAGQLEKSISHSTAAMKPGSFLATDQETDALQNDACLLAADALFELNEKERIWTILAQKEIKRLTPRVGSFLLKRYHENQLYEESLALAERLKRSFPLTYDLPDWLNLLADSAIKLQQESKAYEARADLVMLLPRNSLWRAANQQKGDAISRMEELALPLGEETASYFYETGIKSTQKTWFVKASSIYEVLSQYSPNGERYNEWQARIAHCHYFSEDYDEASKLYAKLKDDQRLKNSTLEIISYQAAMTAERIWRQSFANAVAKNTSPDQNKVVDENLATLEKEISDYANRYSDKPRSIDLLLVMADAYRDHNRFENARKFWERVLVSKPSIPQRAIAIRGLVFSALKKSKASDVVELCRRFLSLENWKELGSTLHNELKGILSRATFEESQNLNHAGQVLKAGALMVSVSRDVDRLPKGEKILRDGAYLLALGGDWNSAYKTAQDYLDSKRNKYRSDMLYLRARASEYQLRFKEAAEDYFNLAKSYPKHPKSLESLDRGQKLAQAEEQHHLAAISAQMLASRQKNRNKKYHALELAYENYLKSKDFDGAISSAKKAQNIARSVAAKLKAGILISRAEVLAKRYESAGNHLNQISNELQRNKRRISTNSYQELAGETHYLKGSLLLLQLNDYKLSERGGSPEARIAQKSQYFDNLSQAFELCASVGDPRWSTKARYELATAADQLAAELLVFVQDENSSFSQKALQQNKETSERLRKMSRRLHSENIIARNKRPELYKNNDWVRLSAIRIGSRLDAPNASNYEQARLTPPQTSFEIPSNWSL